MVRLGVDAVSPWAPIRRLPPAVERAHRPGLVNPCEIPIITGPEGCSPANLERAGNVSGTLTRCCARRGQCLASTDRKKNLMEHIVKPELATATWQRSADVAGVVVAVVVLSILGIFAAVNASSTVSVVIAALVGLTALLFAPAAYAISHTEKN